MDNKTNYIFYNGKKYDCPISMAMGLIGGKWKGVMLYYLKDREKRFNELKKHIPHITEYDTKSTAKTIRKRWLNYSSRLRRKTSD